MKISFSPPDMTELEVQGAAEAIRSGWITTGPKTKEFERRIATYCHTKKAVCLNSQTACEEMALRLLGIGAENGGSASDEVIVPAYTYTASASVVCHVGAKLVLIDSQKDALEMDYDAEYELRDRREDRSRREGSAQADDLITAEEAKAAALKQVGLEDSQVRWGRIEKDYDDGRILYEGKFFYNEMEYEFGVDGRDGRVVEWDMESIYD